MTRRRGLHWLALATLFASGCDKTLSFDAPADEAAGGEPGSGAVSGTGGSGYSGYGGYGGSYVGQGGSMDEPWLRAGGPNQDPPPATGGTSFANDEACIEFCASVGQRCDRNEFRCVECFDDDDCPLERYCDRGLKRCVDCVGDRGCDGDSVCDGSTNTCQEQCLTPSHPDEYCYDPSLMCDDRSNRCVACRGDGDCTEPQLPYCLESGARCAECEGDFHCPDERPRCDPVLFRCVECTDSRNCQLPMVCHPQTHECFNADLGVPFPK